MMRLFTILCCIIVFNSALTFSQKSYGSDLSATIAIPVGTNSKFFNIGYGAIGGIYYEMDSDWRIGLTVGFIRFGLNENELNNHFQQTLGQSGTVDINGSVSTIPILVSFKYLFPGPSTRFYAIIEGGLYTYLTNATGNINYSDGGVAPIDKSEFTSEAGFDLGFGALFPVSEDISFDANIRYHFVRNEGTIKVNDVTGEESVGSSYFLNFAIGANWNFDM